MASRRLSLVRYKGRISEGGGNLLVEIRTEFFNR